MRCRIEYRVSKKVVDKSNSIDQEAAKENFSKFWDTLDGETKRGWLLGAHSYLDELLNAVLANALAKTNATNELLGHPMAPIGSYGARLLLVKALGLLTDEVFSDLKTIGKIRNRCAHDFRFDFTDRSVVDMLKSLQSYGDSQDGEERDPYTHFQICACGYMGMLEALCNVARRGRLTIDSWKSK